MDRGMFLEAVNSVRKNLLGYYTQGKVENEWRKRLYGNQKFIFILGFRDTCWFYCLYSLLASHQKTQFSNFILKIITARKRLKTYFLVP